MDLDGIVKLIPFGRTESVKPHQLGVMELDFRIGSLAWIPMVYNDIHLSGYRCKGEKYPHLFGCRIVKELISLEQRIIDTHLK